MIINHFSLFFGNSMILILEKKFLLKWDTVLLLDSDSLCFRGKSKKDVDSDSRKKKVQPVSLPKCISSHFPDFLNGMIGN